MFIMVRNYAYMKLEEKMKLGVCGLVNGGKK